MLGLTATKNLDEARARIGDLEAQVATAETHLATARKEVADTHTSLLEERRLRVAAEQAAGRIEREWTAKLDRAVADNGVLAAELKRVNLERAAEAEEHRSAEKLLQADIAEAEAERDREREANAALIREHDKTLAALSALRQELAATQSARDALEANQARIRREHEAQLAAEVSAHAATKRLHKANKA